MCASRAVHGPLGPACDGDGGEGLQQSQTQRAYPGRCVSAPHSPIAQIFLALSATMYVSAIVHAGEHADPTRTQSLTMLQVC